jgi:ATP-dependent DNA helicase RecG
MAKLSRLTEVEVSRVKGLGGQRTKVLGKGGIHNVVDLIQHVPRRYIDRSRVEPISSAPVGQEVTILGEVRSVRTRRPRKNLVIVEVRVADDTASIKAVWFNQAFRGRQLSEGTQVVLSGKVESFRGNLQMSGPAVDVLNRRTESLETGRVVPIYPAIGEVSSGVFRRAIHNALTRARPIEDPVPGPYLENLGLIGRDQAYAGIHFPESLEAVTPARERLVYDELFRLELALALQKRRQISESAGFSHQPTGELADRFLAGLPYRLTSAQTRVLEEISSDLAMSHSMHRLLHGEVGSGKTVVAVITLLHGVEGGWQGAIMAPTEVLAEQHYSGVVRLLAQAGLSPEPFAVSSELGMESLFANDGPAVHVGILTGSMAVANYKPDITRQELTDDVASGQVDIVIGTHALIQEGISFARLGVAVVDEQHRFGVAQRVLLKDKATAIDPDLLIMTATPIPRTLSMTLYGDLDVSMIDEMPPGRLPVVTRVLSKSDEAVAWRAVVSEVEAGHQAFVVCPLVDDSPKVEAASATAEFERLSALMADLRVGLIHGQLRPADKDGVMTAFRAGEIDVMVATTVIEVGIDVPNATVMVIEDADRFGLSQLHQLRGRVGRGDAPGMCLLIADPSTEEGEDRLTAMISTSDGYRLAEEDLRIRGQGTVFGTKQSGMPDLKLADVLADIKLLASARHDAFELVARDPELKSHLELAAEVKSMLGDSVAWLFVS